MRNLFTGVLAVGLVFGGLTGCSKKESTEVDAAAAPVEAPADPSATTTAAPAPAPAAPAGGETLPGASSVRDALAKKDYETAVGALLALRGLATGDRAAEYTTLYGEVVDTLRAESSSNPKAAQAYASLVAATRAR